MSLHLKLSDTGLHIVTSDGTRVELSTHMQDLEDFLRTQVRLGLKRVHCSLHTQVRLDLKRVHCSVQVRQPAAESNDNE